MNFVNYKSANAVSEEKIATTMAQLPDYILDRIKASSEKCKNEESENMEARIQAKLQSGAKLTKEELDYIRRTNPMLYAQIMRIQRMAEAVEQQLKNAKSKEEVERIT